jgi:hypothetical protein
MSPAKTGALTAASRDRVVVVAFDVGAAVERADAGGGAEGRIAPRRSLPPASCAEKSARDESLGIGSDLVSVPASASCSARSSSGAAARARMTAAVEAKAARDGLKILE